MAISALEEKFNTCAVCGRKFDKDRALKVHKSKGCNDLPDNPEIVAKLESYHLLPPTEVLVKEVVQAPEVIKEVVVAPVKSEQPPIEVLVPEPVKAPVKAQPELTPVKLGIKSVLPGSLILMDGDVYIIKSGAYEMTQVSALKGVVQRRFTDAQNVNFVDLKGEDGNMYCLPEHMILPPSPYTVPRCKILRLGPEKAFSGAPNVPPVPDKNQFIKAVQDYAQFRDAKTVATKAYETVDKQTRPIITSYVEAVGTPKKGHEEGSCVVEGGYEVHYASKPNPPVHTRDDEIIIDYLLDKGFKHALVEVTEYKIKDEVWDQLKASGIIPEEFVQAHDYMTEKDPTRTLLVTKV